MRLALSATSASAELDLHSAGFVALEIEETAYDYFAELTSRRGGVPAHADCSTDVTRMIFRRPRGFSATDESCELRPGLTLRFSGTVPLHDEAELAKAAELPSWLAPPVSQQPANDNEQEETPKLPEPQHNLLQEERAPAFSDEALALDFAKAHSADLRFVAAWGKWLSYNGKQWRSDDVLLANAQARRICREAANECNEPKPQKALASARTVQAVLSLAKADQRLAAGIDQWDADPWLLNTPGGIVDLRTGRLGQHRPEHYATKLAGATPDPKCHPTAWLSFLHKITGGDLDLISFLRRMSGYALTGLTSEQVLFFLYGTGANGKSTFLQAISNGAGEYHRVAPIDTFIDSQNDRHPTELAGLRGARLVTAVETEEGRRWAESKIKALTGGDKISARFMRQDFFEYVPQFKLIIAGNHKPGLRSVDEAIRRRLHLIPFGVKIPERERDKELSAKLVAELPGIMAWMIEGCLEWQAQGLQPPSAVSKATDAYLEAEDSLAAWMSECCESVADSWENSTRLFESWTEWAQKAGETIGSQKRFSDRLESKGLERLRKNVGRGFVGLKLKVRPSYQSY